MNIRDQQQIRKILKDFFLTFIGIFCAGLGLEGFLLPNGFIDGGATGISLLVTEITGLPLPILIVIINIPFLVVGYKQISPNFAIRSAGAIAGLAIWITFFHYPVLTQEKLLISVFGGFFLGAGIGFAIRGGCVIDGTEILAISIAKKTGLTVGDVILIINIFIFGAAAFLLDINTSLYSLLTYLAASKTVDFIIHGIEEYVGVTIISEKNESVRKNIIKKVGSGVTIYKGKKGFSDSEIDIIYTITTRLETSKLKNEILSVDPYAFIIESPVNHAEGGMVKKRPLQH
jgi:uncharacterized membrane-anchored protein YitT (DUF2179 family)